MPQGYAAPNPVAYPWQWLWDSCFHVLVWQALGDADRARRELAGLFGPQASSGFVPHVNYVRDPEVHADLWGRSGGSSITQPPMYGHAVATLVRAGAPPADGVVAAASAGIRFLLGQRARDPSGLLLLCHPWESGADDSPRWDGYCPGGFDPERWRAEKSRLAFNARELASVMGDAAMDAAADELTRALAARWDGDLGTWVDAGPAADGSGRCRTGRARRVRTPFLFR